MQQQFFSMLKNSLPAHISLADELSEKMGLSYDSIYRRMRGEKALSMAELKMLCKHYNISLDQVMGLETDTVVFMAPDINIDDLRSLTAVCGKNQMLVSCLTCERSAHRQRIEIEPV